MYRALVVVLCLVPVLPYSAHAWNIPTHMITGAMAHRLLQSQNPQAAASVEAILEKHPWYADRWRDEIARLPEEHRPEALFMWAARWADDIRMQARLQREVVWHYINYPFKPEREPEHIRPLPPLRENILSAIAENKRVVSESTEAEKRAIALAWVFHLVGDIHQPLHTVQLFTREYPNGDRGGNEVCVRLAADRAAIDLHRLWDGLITSTNNVGQLSRIATELLAKFSRVGLRELDNDKPEAWAKESYEIATKIAYEGGNLRGTHRGSARECREVRDANFLSRGYPARAKLIAERRVYLAAVRLADTVMRSYLR